MKRCPECGREYDLSMSFCLDDGAELLYGPASMDEPATAILSDTSSEAKTAAQIQTTEQTAIQPPSISKMEGLDKRFALAAIALAIVGLGGFFGYRYFAANNKQINSIA